MSAWSLGRQPPFAPAHGAVRAVRPHLALRLGLVPAPRDVPQGELAAASQVVKPPRQAVYPLAQGHATVAQALDPGEGETLDPVQGVPRAHFPSSSPSQSSIEGVSERMTWNS